jgi:hypothetical protein
METIPKFRRRSSPPSGRKNIYVSACSSTYFLYRNPLLKITVCWDVMPRSLIVFYPECRSSNFLRNAGNVPTVFILQTTGTFTVMDVIISYLTSVDDFSELNFLDDGQSPQTPVILCLIHHCHNHCVLTN